MLTPGYGPCPGKSPLSLAQGSRFFCLRLTCWFAHGVKSPTLHILENYMHIKITETQQMFCLLLDPLDLTTISFIKKKKKTQIPA